MEYTESVSDMTALSTLRLSALWALSHASDRKKESMRHEVGTRLDAHLVAMNLDTLVKLFVHVARGGDHLVGYVH